MTEPELESVYYPRKFGPGPVGFPDIPPDIITLAPRHVAISHTDQMRPKKGRDGDVGGAHLETQQAMRQICGENLPILVLLLPFLHPSAPAISRRPPFRAASGPCGRWQHFWAHDGYVGRAYLETQQATGQIRGENRPTLAPVRHFPDPVRFRLLPPSPIGIRFAPYLVRVDDGKISGGHGDVGGSYLETQQVMGRICGANRPILVLFLPFLLP